MRIGSHSSNGSRSNSDANDVWADAAGLNLCVRVRETKYGCFFQGAPGAARVRRPSGKSGPRWGARLGAVVYSYSRFLTHGLGGGGGGGGRLHPSAVPPTTLPPGRPRPGSGAHIKTGDKQAGNDSLFIRRESAMRSCRLCSGVHDHTRTFPTADADIAAFYKMRDNLLAQQR